MPLISRQSLIARLRRGAKERQRFVQSHLSKTIAHQIRAMRDKAGWTQGTLAEEIGTNQNGIYRLESPDYGRATLTTLKRVAAAFDVALVVRFVPFGELVDWASSTPRVHRGLNTAALEVASFNEEFSEAAAKTPTEIVSLGDVPLKMARTTPDTIELEAPSTGGMGHQPETRGPKGIALDTGGTRADLLVEAVS